jgi:hypothetical protein
MTEESSFYIFPDQLAVLVTQSSVQWGPEAISLQVDWVTDHSLQSGVEYKNDRNYI